MLMTMSLPYSRGGSPGAPIDAEVRHLGMIINEHSRRAFVQRERETFSFSAAKGCSRRRGRGRGGGGGGGLGSEALGCECVPGWGRRCGAPVGLAGERRDEGGGRPHLVIWHGQLGLQRAAGEGGSGGVDHRVRIHLVCASVPHERRGWRRGRQDCIVAETICTSTQPPQSRWSRTETVQSAASPTARFWRGSVHVTTPSSPAFMSGHGYVEAAPFFVHVQPVSLAAACGRRGGRGN